MHLLIEVLHTKNTLDLYSCTLLHQKGDIVCTYVLEYMSRSSSGYVLSTDKQLGNDSIQMLILLCLVES